MKQIQNIILVGTSHIAQQSVEEVSRIINQKKPQIIALELDEERFQALKQKKKKKISLRQILTIGWKGFLFALLGSYLQKKLGQLVKVSPGEEMRKAIELAKKNKIKIALIDQPLRTTLRRISEELTWKEKGRFILDIGKGFFGKKWGKRLKKKFPQGFDLTKLPSKQLLRELIKEFKQRYPSLYQILVKERNQVLSQNLIKLQKENPKEWIIAIMGAGHEEEVESLIKKQINKTKST